jgi:Stage II sporulation protein E (SpoIIE)
VAGDPAEMLTRINRSLLAILRHSESTLFVTGFYLVADTAGSQILYANAGHPEPFLLNRLQGELQSMSANGSGGPPLGLFDDARYGNCECPMSPDDFIMLFTDGLFEVQAPDEQMYSRERLETAVRNRVSLPSAKILPELLNEIREFSKHKEFSDDVCLLGMDVKRYEHRLASKDSILSERVQRPTAVKPRGRMGNCESCYQPEPLFSASKRPGSPQRERSENPVRVWAESSTPTTPTSTKLTRTIDPMTSS